jgi:hypothetical protein
MRGQTTSLEEEFLMVDMAMPSTYQAVIPLSFGSAQVALLNTGDMDEHATITCVTEAGEHLSSITTLASHQMAVKPACSQMSAGSDSEDEMDADAKVLRALNRLQYR